jgi:hypothetical protein
LAVSVLVTDSCNTSSLTVFTPRSFRRSVTVTPSGPKHADVVATIP